MGAQDTTALATTLVISPSSVLNIVSLSALIATHAQVHPTSPECRRRVDAMTAEKVAEFMISQI